MQNNPKKNIYCGLGVAVLVVWLVMNVRVAAGIGSTFERAVDGLVGVGLVVAAVFLALEFFHVIGEEKE